MYFTRNRRVESDLASTVSMTWTFSCLGALPLLVWAIVNIFIGFGFYFFLALSIWAACFIYCMSFLLFRGLPDLERGVGQQGYYDRKHLTELARRSNEPE